MVALEDYYDLLSVAAMLCADLKAHLGAGFAVMFITAGLCVGVVMQMNHMLAAEKPEVYTVPVVQMYVDNNCYSDDYNCVVQFED